MAENDKFYGKLPRFEKRNITDKLDIYNWVEDVSCYSKLTFRMSVFNNKPSISLIKEKNQRSYDFRFEFVSTNQVLKCINEIDCSKSSGGDIPAKIIKMAKEELAVPITNCINSCILSSIFPENLISLTLSQYTKNKMWIIKLTINQLVYYQLFQKYLKRSFIHS